MSGEQGGQEAMNVYSVTLSGPAPWGFRLQGGKDFSMPLTVSRLTPGGKAAQAGVGVGDWVVSIDNFNAEDMTHVEAQNKIRGATDSLTLTLSKAFKAGSDQKMETLDNLEPTPSPAKAQAADKPDESKTAPAAAGRSGPSSRPPWVTDANFADRFRPDKTSTVLTQHQQPVQPTPMQNRSSILQAAQQAPEDSGRTPLCGACNKIIRGRYLVALGRSWHPEEFTCSQCKAVLEEGGFFEERGSVYCTKCHDNRYAPNCAKCKKKITGEIMHALKMTYHVQCFKCAACKTPIRNQAFYMEEGEPYCEKDYEKMFGTKCHGCDFKIDAGDRFLEALGYSWHDTCFVCALCQINLEGKTFYSKKDKPLCKGHAFAPV
ncbi:PDZ and LIM domain protein 7 isoform X5 [Micropterus salmoides]|uniref:PDZ and LIM domain protein 7 isoform X5 n=1 Tax=Micropterus salmoides TaxID=27706 RepID=UPI0018EBEC15|nr:PDZ and LIM domain protein 7 isoform X5 [Micropterus salmoides]